MWRYIASLLFAIPCCAQFMPTPGPGPYPLSGSPPTWSLIQSPQKFSCTFTDSATSHTCTITSSAVAAGDGVAVLSTMFYYGMSTGPTGAPSYTSTSGDSSLAACGTGTNKFGIVFNTVAQNYIVQACAVTTSAVGGGSSWTVTMATPHVFSGSTSAIDIVLVEFKKSAGTIAIDAQNNTSSSSCTSCAAPSLTIGGANDYIVAVATLDNSITNPSSPWTNPTATETTYVLSGWVGALNQTSYTAPAFTQSPTGYAVLSVIAFK